MTETTTAGCVCGKAAYPSKAAADRVVVNAKIRRSLHSRAHRREERSYRCTANPDNWHVTSQSGKWSPQPKYPNTDDTAARTFISRAVEHPRDDVWAALLDDERVRQTVRVLRTLQQECVTARAGGWKDPGEQQRALEWETAVLLRVREARTAERAFNIRETEQKEDSERRHNHYVLRVLTLAIAEHRQTATTATPEDQKLWVWLDTLKVPHKGGMAPLSDLVNHWRDRT